MRGWIPAWRKLFEREDWLRPTKKHPAGKREAWLDLCQMAQHEDYEHVGERLQRGEVLVSISGCMKRWAWSKMRVRWFLDRLICDTMVSTARNTPHGTVYRIVNYDTYAISGNSQQHSQRHSQQHSNSTAAAPEQECTTNKEAISSAFEEVWSVCRRGSKRQAFDQYRKAVPAKVTHDGLLKAWVAHVGAASEQKYVKALERWIRDERWHEEVNAKPVSGALARPRLRA